MAEFNDGIAETQPPQAATVTTDVLIVGSGPAGASAALFLSTLGVDNIMVTTPGYRTLVTHIFVRGDELLDSDTVFGVKDSLIKDFVAQPPGTPAPNERDLSGSGWSKVQFDIVLAPRSA